MDRDGGPTAGRAGNVCTFLSAWLRTREEGALKRQQLKQQNYEREDSFKDVGVILEASMTANGV